MPRLLLLQHAWEDSKGYLGTLLDEYGIAYDIIDVTSETLPDPAEYIAVIALGGYQHVYQAEHYPYMAQEKALLRHVIARDIPYLGICLGGQLLADVLGGQVRRYSRTEIGFFDVHITPEGQQDPLYAGLPGYQTVFQWHEDIFDLPTGAVLLATSSETENQAFRYGRCAYGLQYHVELDTDMLDTWLYYPEFKEQIVHALGSDAYSALQGERAARMPRYQEHMRLFCQNFLQISGAI